MPTSRKPWLWQWQREPFVNVVNAVRRAGGAGQNYDPVLNNNSGGTNYNRYLPFTNGAGAEDYQWEFVASPVWRPSGDVIVYITGVMVTSAGATTETIITDAGIASYANNSAHNAIPSIATVATTQVGTTSGTATLTYSFTISAPSVTAGGRTIFRLFRNQGTYLQVYRITDVALYHQVRGGNV